MVSQTFRCRIVTCRAAFTRKGDLQRHERTHTGDRPHVCTLCTKAFSQASGLKTHMNTHTGEKPYSCTIPGCRRMFGDRSSCTRHILERHGNLEPYQCPECTTKIKRKTAFKIHLQTKHGIDDFNEVADKMDDCGRTLRRARRGVVPKIEIEEHVPQMRLPTASLAQYHQSESQSPEVEMTDYTHLTAPYDSAYTGSLGFDHHAALYNMPLSRPPSATPSLCYSSSQSPSPVPSCYTTPTMVPNALPPMGDHFVMDPAFFGFDADLKGDMMMPQDASGWATSLFMSTLQGY